MAIENLDLMAESTISIIKKILHRPPLFIVGCDRSGTTLLRLMLTQGKDIHIPQESRFICRLSEFSDVYGDFSKAYQRWFFIRDLQHNKATCSTYAFPIFGLSIIEAEKIIEAVSPITYTGAVASLFAASAVRAGKSYWGDKTPRQVNEIRFLADAFPDSKFIHVIRDGRDVALSIRKAGWMRNVAEIAEYWKKQVMDGKRASSHLDKSRYMEIFYEDLVEEPRKILNEICSWLSVPYSDKMLSFYEKSDKLLDKSHAHLFGLTKKPVDNSQIGKWKKALNNFEQAEFEKTSGDLLNQLGYELSGAKIPFYYTLIEKGYDNLLPLLKTTRKQFLNRA